MDSAPSILPGSYRGLDLQDQRLKILTDEFGERNVEEALIFVSRACDHGGRRVVIRPTWEMLRSLLEAVHGRLDVGAVRVPGLVGA